MSFKKRARRFWRFLHEDSWYSWIVSLILIVIFIKFVFFPLLSLLTGSSLPLVVIESCSMYHESNFDEWWDKNAAWYEARNISKEDFKSFNYKNGLNKGDIILVTGWGEYEKGDVIIFNAATAHPIIHRIVDVNPLATKGDHNLNQLDIEKNINEENIIGKASFRLPFVGWVKLAIFELLRSESERGLCK